MNPGADVQMASSELRQLMVSLSLRGSSGLAMVAEVRHDVAKQWLSGEKPIPNEVIVMLRGLAAIHHGSARSR